KAIQDLSLKVVEVERKELLSDKPSLFGPPLLKDSTVKMISQVAQDLGVSWEDALGLIQKYIASTQVTSWKFSSFIQWYSNLGSNKPME
ncbi:MAG TPA: hypothetical protein PKL15_06370, partial [Saprospiraceae bacterium]|nr:hypothetical protein [Saprospiraceae bacterium]